MDRTRPALRNGHVANFASLFEHDVGVKSTGARQLGSLASMDARALLAELAPTAETLFNRHLETSKGWSAHEFVPFSRGRDYTEESPWEQGDSQLSDLAQSALYVNLLTEDNLPYYTHTLLKWFGEDDVWSEWGRRWTTEEHQHGEAIRMYLMVTRGVDPVMLEEGRKATMSTGWDAGWTTPLDGLVYPTLQELATRISHRNTAKLIDDPAGRELMNRVVTDENFHFLFYRDVCTAALELDPSSIVRSLERVVREFAMPGTGIPGFAIHAKRMADASIYDVVQHYEQILVPIVLRHFKVEQLEGLTPEGEQARDKLVHQIGRIGRLAERIADRRASKEEARAN